MSRNARRLPGAAVVCLLLAAASLVPDFVDVQAQTSSGGNKSGENNHRSRVSPTERIHRNARKPRTDHNTQRPIDGYGNNYRDPTMNSADTQLRRLMPNAYSDGYSVMAGLDRPNPRVISNAVFSQAGDRKNKVGATDFVWQWGQFLDHDIDLTGGIDPPENFPIGAPAGDPWFSNGLAMDFNRSIYVLDKNDVRQQVNEITGWIDASNIYGSDDERTTALRTLDGTGRLKTGTGNLLPNNVDGLPNAGGDSNLLFLSGDVRVNEQVALTAMHTLFMREHNRWAGILRAELEASRDRNAATPDSRQMYSYRDRHGNRVYSDRPPAGQQKVIKEQKSVGQSQRHSVTADDDEIFERARALVIAEMQHITFDEFLPVLLGRNGVSRYSGYRSNIDARISNEFSTAAFRLGHSMLSPTLLRLDENGEPIASGHLPLRMGFFAPDQVRLYGIESLLRGMSQQLCQDVDSFVIDDVRNFLFGAPGQGGFDLVSLNIQRGRDHGLPGYNDARRQLGLKAASSFYDISRDPETRQRLADTYASVEDIDLWVGGMAEDKFRNSMLGELFYTLVRQQFEALRDGDRFWYINVLDRHDQERIEALSLADIIRLNTNITDEIQDNVFVLSPGHQRGRR